jgi:hypothetical protein
MSTSQVRTQRPHPYKLRGDKGKQKASDAKPLDTTLRPPDHDLLPRISEVWRGALAAVKIDRPGQGILSNAYVFPPLDLFLHATKGMAYLACWALIRSQWIGSLTMGSFEDIAETSSALPKRRVWAGEVRRMSMEWYSDLFHTTDNPSNPSAPRGSRSRPSKVKADERRKERVAAEAGESFSFLRAQNSIPANISNSGLVIQHDNKLAITPITARLLLWDLSQCHAHGEFVILDRVRRPDLADNPARIRLVSSVFAQSRQFPTLPPTDDQVDMGGPMFYQAREGRESELRVTRLQRLRNFREVLKAWPRAKEFNCIVNNVDCENRQQYEQMQFECYFFYCRTFFDTFGRAPTLPRYLPDGWQ